MGVATVAVLYAAVRRRFGPGAGLLAGAVLALTPVAALMFRFNNPDALLALLMVSATVYCVLRALEDARTKWLVLAGVVLGARLPHQDAPGLADPARRWPSCYAGVRAGPAAAPRRANSCSAGGRWCSLAAGGWRIVELWPAASRPYIGGSQHNSFLELTLGYNGFGRLTGNETGSVGGGGNGGGPAVAAPAAGEAAAGARPASGGCSTPTWAARSPGCCPPRWSCWRPGWS